MSESEIQDLGKSLTLETFWVLYAHVPCASTNYGISYMKIGEFNTVAEFWNLFNNIPDITCIHDGVVYINGQLVIAYSLFRDGILPEWEDDVNLGGSEWGCRENLSRDLFVEIWKRYILGAIGECIPHCVGVRAINKSNRVRRLHKIEVWMDKTETKQIQECRRSLTVLFEESPKFAYIPHQEKQNQAIEYNNRKKRRHGHGASQ